MREICSKKRVLFVGAEALLLKGLMICREYKTLAQEFFPQEEFSAYYICPPNRGLDISKSIDEVIRDAIATIEQNEIDVAFFSLGGYAKIAASEVSKTTGIACCDFGSNLRSLCYSMTRFDTLKRDYCAYMGFTIDLSIYCNAAEFALGSDYFVNLREIIKNQIFLDLNQKIRGVGAAKYTGSVESIELAKKSLEHVKNNVNGAFSIAEILSEIHKETGLNLLDALRVT